jgi:drug/metabolite transporter (DMT)-like permease
VIAADQPVSARDDTGRRLESDGGRTSVTGVVLCLVTAVCNAGGVVCQKLALRRASAVHVTTFGCFTGTEACLPFAGSCCPSSVRHTIRAGTI